jgi:hypothetical protein
MNVGEFNNTFTYDAPCVGRRIRLLSLLPGSGSDQLAVLLEEVVLDSSDISFTAFHMSGEVHTILEWQAAITKQLASL